jgi:uncharacterized protein
MLTRRALLRNSALTGAAMAAGGLSAILPASAAGALPAGGYGPLVPDPNGLLDLPAGFSYSVIARSAAWTSVIGPPAASPTPYTGTSIPSGDGCDGTGSFARPGGGTILVRNSELSGTAPGGIPQSYGSPAVAVPTYDPGHRGGTSTLNVDAAGNLVSIVPSLSGTISNCAGGTTPWGTWLTCEETETLNGAIQHGYVFEVDPSGAATQALPITGMGRFPHEAVVIDPATGTAYLTEDASGPLGLFYRYVPTNTSGAYGSLRDGGTLSAMRCTKAGGVVVQNLAEATLPGTTYDVTWVPVPNANPTGTLVATAGPSQRLRNQFADADITRSKKFEGLWFGEGKVWIAVSYAKSAADIVGGGSFHEGQVWLYDPVAQTLTLKVRTAPGGLFDGPDNIVVAPFGGAFLCEDGDGDNYVAGIGSDDLLFAFARNVLTDSEFTGACFSPDGGTMFVNIQSPGTTYAITGPWTGGPPPVVPEAPMAVMLPLAAGAAALAGAVMLRNRQNAEQPELPVA